MGIKKKNKNKDFNIQVCEVLAGELDVDLKLSNFMFNVWFNGPVSFIGTGFLGGK